MSDSTLYIGDHVIDRDDDDATMLVVGRLPERASEYVIDTDDGTTVADCNEDYPEDDCVLEVIFAQRTRIDIEDSHRYAYPRSRLERVAAVHDDDAEGEN